MRLFYILVLLIGLAAPTALAQSKLPASPQIPIMAWSGIPSGDVTAQKFRELKEMGININLMNCGSLSEMIKALDLAQATGLKMVTSCPELKSDPKNTVDKVKNHPALAGYFLRDEPIFKDFEALGSWAAEINKADGSHFCFVNLIASIHPTLTEALGTPGYAAYVRTFLEKVPVQLISFDFYPVLPDGLHERWYEGLGIVAAESKKSGKPFWAFALASSYNELHPEPTLETLRLQLFSNLAYGASGLEYWSYRMSDGLRSAPIGKDGKRTVVYDLIRTVNKEIQDVAYIFSGSKVVSVSHTGTIIPRGATRLTTLPWAIRVFETEEAHGALVSQIEKDGNTFFIVLNRDTKEKMTYFLSGEPALKKVLSDGSIEDASGYSKKVTLAPGSWSIYQFPTVKP